MDVATLRQELGMSLREMGASLGVSHAAVHAWELEKALPSPAMANRIIQLAESNGIRMRLEDVYPRNGD